MRVMANVGRRSHEVGHHVLIESWPYRYYLWISITSSFRTVFTFPQKLKQIM